MRNRPASLSWIIGVGLLLIGYYSFPSAWGYGLFGFGLASALWGGLAYLFYPERNHSR
ncbi:hypothetical protein JIR001_26940 [Polycladomyces abyssicola]|uniref:Uncharacterized protein n=1 Tax=Polycladomyces abyssicola TaxID=1125966 RepID=A0A8D5UI63_9BACL|nr:hypothetical protein [Polycladomyces abyssicola]BCU82911.1 hypothetical protein JIR001_26940 [Polycladomyces abyssicola]